jgi:hypothetical protein
MLTGEPLFQGETVSHILASVLKDQPDLGRVPDKVRPLLRRCLERDPKKRLRDISGVELLLEEIPAPQPARKTGASRLWMIAAGLLALTAIGFGTLAFREYPEEPRLLKLSMPTPDKSDFSIPGTIPQISPDGRHIVFAPVIEGQSDLWVRDLDSVSLRMLPGATGASFWAPDSRWVGFFTNDKLKKVDVTGGPPVTI